MKICIKCKINKKLELFPKNKNTCKLCRSLYLRKWHNEKPNYQLEKSKERWLFNKERMGQISKIYHKKNKQIISKKRKIREQNNPILLEKKLQYNKKYEKCRYQKDINYKLKKRLRCRLYMAFKNNQKTGSAVKDLGCSLNKLKIHLQLKFHRNPRGKHEYMTWDNYGEWHIDHIKPLSSFDLFKREELLKACHYTNLQPLWAKDNIRKSSRLHL